MSKAKQTIEVDGRTFTADDIRTAMAKSSAIAKAAQDYLSYSSALNGIPPAPGQFDLRQCSDGGKCILAYWRLFDLLHPDSK